MVVRLPDNYAEISTPSETDISTKKLSIVRHVVTDPVVFGSESHWSSASRVNAEELEDISALLRQRRRFEAEGIITLNFRLRNGGFRTILRCTGAN
jgi:hypothetical protein